MIRRYTKKRKGQALVEYIVIVAGVLMVSIVGISLFGHKVAGMVNMATVILPGAHDGGNRPIMTGRLVEYAPEDAGDENSPMVLGLTQIQGHFGTQRLSNNLWDVDAGEIFTPGGH